MHLFNYAKRSTKFLGIFALATICYAVVIPVPVHREKLVGSWIGFTDPPNDFYRLVLTDTAGVVAHNFTGREPILYSITSWQLGPRGELTTAITGVSTNSYPIIITGKMKSSKLDLVIRSPGQAWQHAITFYQEQLIEDRIRLLKNSMEALPEGRTKPRK
jgi:hypothetical protein